MKKEMWKYGVIIMVIIAFVFFIIHLFTDAILKEEKIHASIEPMENEIVSTLTENQNLDEMRISNSINRNDYDCYLINLEKNVDRLTTFTTYYNNSDLSSKTFIKMKAIYGKDIDYSSFISPRVEMNMTPGMVGCFLSHLEVYKNILNGDKQFALVFEDDARMIRNIQKSVIETILQIIPSDWDIVLLGYDVSNPVHHKIVQFNGYIKPYGFYGTHAYLINKTGAEKLLKLVKMPFTNQIDHEMGELCELGLMNVYGIQRPVVWQEARFTDVQTNPE
jgi:GR25 family glycosyltransferase involved in LPS biosynthesis